MSTPPIDFNGLDTVVHGPLRLGVLTALRMVGPLDFTTLKKRLGSSDGVLGQNLLKLEEIGYINADKAFVGRRPKTTYRLTASGTSALAGYLDAMRTLLDAIEAKRHQGREAEGSRVPPG